MLFSFITHALQAIAPRCIVVIWWLLNDARRFKLLIFFFFFIIFNAFWSILAVFHQSSFFAVKNPLVFVWLDCWSEYISWICDECLKILSANCIQPHSKNTRRNISNRKKNTKTKNNRSQWLVRAPKQYLLLYGMCVWLLGVIMIIFFL